MDDITIGIDLGTTNSCVGIWDNATAQVHIIENEDGNTTTPSWVAFSNGEKIVGHHAKEEYTMNIENTIYDVKRLMGKKYNEIKDLHTYTYNIIPDSNGNILIDINNVGKFKPEEISALILNKMKSIAEKYLQKPVRNAVITVPAYFNDAGRIATKNAATIAGLNCVRIINEPTSACMCYGLDKKDMSTVLIFDLGGGTFDVSILEIINGTFNVLSTNGNTHLGGEDFNKLLIEHLITCFQKQEKVKIIDDSNNRSNLREIAEKVKKQLSVSTITTVLISLDCEDNKTHKCKVTINRSKFEELCNNLFRSCLIPLKNAIDDAYDSAGTKITIDSIDQIVLVGGSTRIPMIQQMLKEYFNNKPLNYEVNPDHAVAYGAAIQGVILNGNDSTEKTKDIVLIDVIPLSLGIKSGDGLMSKIIRKNSNIPISNTCTYTTQIDYQKSVKLEIYEGEREFVIDNHLLGVFELTNIQYGVKGAPKIDVTFSIDENGILSIKAIDKSTFTSIDVKVENNNKLSADEIQRMIKDAEKFKARDENLKDCLEFSETFNNYLDTCLRDINNKEYNEILTDDEITYVNQLILNNKTWLNEEEEEYTKTKELLENTFNTVKHILSEYMNKIYSRQLLINGKKEIEQEPMNDELLNKIVNQKLK